MNPMNIRAKKGAKVVFMNKNGYDYQPIDAVAAGLIENGIYTVSSVDIGRSTSRVTLEEFPDESFNTVMFCDEGSENEEDEEWIALPPRKPKSYYVNTNASCKVKLTEFGEGILLKHYTAYHGHQKALEFITGLHKPDEEGFTRFQLWDLFQIFGSEFQIGMMEVPFVDNSIIMLDLVTEVPAKADQ